MGSRQMPDAGFFELVTQKAQELIELEKIGKPKALDFSVSSTCSFCFSHIKGRKPLVCSACKSTIFCSKDCAKKGWKQSPVRGCQTHSDLCESNKRHMLRLPEFKAILTQFPWGRIETDGTFSEDIARGRYKVLGSTGFGFWAHRGGPIPHLPSGSEVERLKDESMPPDMKELVKIFNYMDGTTLLATKHLSDREGWKLEPELIPFRNFSMLWSPPRLVTKVEIKDWDSWYRWRNIPKESPSALLMGFPMSVYWLLVHTLKVADPKSGSYEGDRIKLNVQYLGAETELNFLPLFSELALLLPHTDIKLTVFGVAVKNLVDQAKKLHPNSLVGKSSSTTPVFIYTAPEECGCGKIEIFLHGDAAQWAPPDGDAKLSKYGKPDAIVALNAGLASYPSWFPVVVWTHATETPFAVTEYAEQSCETQQMMLSATVQRQAMIPGSICSGPGVPMGEEVTRSLMKSRTYSIEMNPFQKPGQRPFPTKLPDVSNGFTMRVVGEDD